MWTWIWYMILYLTGVLLIEMWRWFIINMICWWWASYILHRSWYGWLLKIWGFMELANTFYFLEGRMNITSWSYRIFTRCIIVGWTFTRTRGSLQILVLQSLFILGRWSDIMIIVYGVSFNKKFLLTSHAMVLLFSWYCIESILCCTNSLLNFFGQMFILQELV